jgi:hypothetical protein
MPGRMMALRIRTNASLEEVAFKPPGERNKEAGARRYTGLQNRLPRLKGPETHSHNLVIGIFRLEH